MSIKIEKEDQSFIAEVSNLLQNVPLFRGLSADSYDVLSKRFIKMKFPRNTTIFNEGDELTAIYLIVSGKIEKNERINRGCETITDIKEPGQYFGEQALLGDSSQKYSVTTIEDTELAVLNKHDFVELLNQPAFVQQLVRGLIAQLSSQPKKFKSLIGLDIYGGVARVLLDLAEKNAGEREVDKYLVVKEVTREFCIASGFIYHLLKELEIGGYITIGDEGIIIDSLR